MERAYFVNLTAPRVSFKKNAVIIFHLFYTASSLAARQIFFSQGDLVYPKLAGDPRALGGRYPNGAGLSAAAAAAGGTLKADAVALPPVMHGVICL